MGPGARCWWSGDPPTFGVSSRRRAASSRGPYVGILPAGSRDVPHAATVVTKPGSGSPRTRSPSWRRPAPARPASGTSTCTLHSPPARPIRALWPHGEFVTASVSAANLPSSGPLIPERPPRRNGAWAASFRWIVRRRCWRTLAIVYLHFTMSARAAGLPLGAMPGGGGATWAGEGWGDRPGGAGASAATGRLLPHGTAHRPGGGPEGSRMPRGPAPRRGTATAAGPPARTACLRPTIPPHEREDNQVGDVFRGRVGVSRGPMSARGLPR